MRTIWGVAGGLIVLATLMSEVRTLVVPRVFRPGLSSMLGRGVYRAFQLVSNCFDRYESKDRILAPPARCRWSPGWSVGSGPSWSGTP